MLIEIEFFDDGYSICCLDNENFDDYEGFLLGYISVI